MAQQPTSQSYPPDIAGEITSSASKEFVLRKRLFIGGLAAAESAAFLREQRVTHVLSVAGGPLDVCIGGSGDLIDQQAIAHKTVDVVDHPSANILAVLDDALAFLDEAMDPPREEADDRGRDGSSVLVHCASGVSRSATAVAAWLMTRHGLGLEDALSAVKDGRPQANPNLGFVKQLQLLEQELRGGCDEQVAPAVPPCAGAAIARASERWSRDTAPDAMAEARRQREAANELHARADALEVEASKLASESGAPAAAGGSSGAPALDAKSRLHAALEILQTEMDSCLPSEADGFVDRPARMILKSASSKTARLLAALES